MLSLAMAEQATSQLLWWADAPRCRAGRVAEAVDVLAYLDIQPLLLGQNGFQVGIRSTGPPGPRRPATGCRGPGPSPGKAMGEVCLKMADFRAFSAQQSALGAPEAGRRVDRHTPRQPRHQPHQGEIQPPQQALQEAVRAPACAVNCRR